MFVSLVDSSPGSGRIRNTLPLRDFILPTAVQHDVRPRREAKARPVRRHQRRQVPGVRRRIVQREREAGGGKHLLREAVLQVVHHALVGGEVPTITHVVLNECAT